MAIKTIEIKKSAFDMNSNRASRTRNELKSNGSFFINVMASPGAGKTTTLTAIINELKDEFKMAVMEADVDSVVDAIKIEENTGIHSIQIHTDGQCHMDADMTKEGLDGLDNVHYDIIFLENVGNMVCPAEFDTGSHLNLFILSVPEGDDKPLKYPLMYQVSDVVLINKIDTLDYFDFSVEKAKKNILMRNKDAKIFTISAKRGDGVKEFCEYLKKYIINWRTNNA
ncbi:MAG: hydrogenase nickel incorporation protein HypB [Gammaproteobacteria bacterium]|nr:hydrogenase nickel incorporation protein HypB [Gammaproteobacteria bacterium]